MKVWQSMLFLCSFKDNLKSKKPKKPQKFPYKTEACD